MSRASEEGSSIRRGYVPTRLHNGEAGSGRRSRELVLFEAESTTEWYRAIERKDCKTLMSLLRQDEGSALLLKTGKAGRTALHVAAMQGSLELVHIIRGFFPDVNVNAQCVHKLTVAIDGRCGMNAVDIASKIVGYSGDHMMLGGPDSSPFAPFLALLADFWQSEYKLTRENVNGVEEVIISVLQGCYGGLIESFKQNVDYNFCSFGIHEYLFLFHHACSRVDGQEFVKDVITHCLQVSIEQLNELMQLRDFQGRTPLHVAVAVAPAKDRDYVLENLLRSWKFYDHEEPAHNFLGVRDGRGWTPLHLAATQPYSDAIEKLISSADIEIITARISGNYGINPDSLEEFGKNPYCTAIHLAVLHNNPEIVDQLLRASTELCDNFNHFTLERKIYCEFLPNEMFGHWTVLSLALLLADDDVLEVLLPWVDKTMGECSENYGAPPIICLAASSGNTKILRHLMNDLCFHPFKKDLAGRTSLHYAVVGILEPRNDDGCTWKTMIKPRQAYPYVWAVDVPNVLWLDEVYESSPQVRGVNKGHSGRKVCVNMLLQAGVELWEVDNGGRLANPGRRIIDEDFLIWWCERMEKETLNTTNSLCQAGNAISVMGALIATASYVGPLQPPLSYGSDPSIPPTLDNTLYAHYWDKLVMCFLFTNSMSFYFAIASLMLSFMPSLPRVQGPFLKELEIKRILEYSPRPRVQEPFSKELEIKHMFLVSSRQVLFVAVICFIISYGAALMAVVPLRIRDEKIAVLPLTIRALPMGAATLGLLCCLYGYQTLGRHLPVLIPEKVMKWFEYCHKCLKYYIV